jgi:2-polyprenyl-3-methyl-5-hydroxy-6-metoxy-1,4-benzoquinol methylase
MSSCPSCAGESLQLLESIDVAKQHEFYAPDNPAVQANLTAALQNVSLSYQMVRCTACTLEFSLPLSAPPAEWYGVAYRALNLYPSERWEFNEVLDRISKTGGNLFEIGCGSGSFLEQCRAKGISAQGIDFAPDAVQECARKGLDVALATLAEPSPSNLGMTFKHISAFHVLEHLDNPKSLFELASNVAAPDAHLWIAVPAEHRPSRRFGDSDFLDQPPHHMTRWNAEAFSMIGKSTIWKLAEVTYEPVSLTSALWSISVASSVYKNSKAKTRSKLLERALRVALLPYAIAKRLTSQRQLTGFSILAHFVRK